MRDCNQGRVQQQVSFLRRQFLQEGDLPFASVLSEETISTALESIDLCWKDRIYTPLVTLWVFLGQVISADHSCRAAVARLIAHRISQGLGACSSRTSAYCQARKRLPEKFFSVVTCLMAHFPSVQSRPSRVEARAKEGAGLLRAESWKVERNAVGSCWLSQSSKTFIGN